MTFENKSDQMEARISAYAFGELEGEELTAMQAAEAADPILALRVAELRAFGDEIGATLKNEPEPLAPMPAIELIDEPAASSRGHVLHFPRWAWMVAGLATAAGVAVMMFLNRSGVRADRPETVSAEIQPAPAETAELRTLPIISVPVPVEDAPKPIVPEAPAALVAVAPVPAPADEVPETAPPPSEKGKDAPLAPVQIAVAEVPAAVPPANPAPAVDPGMELRAMLNKGRSQYAAGDLDGAAALFDAVKKVDVGNREAGYFAARIGQDRSRGSGGASSASRRFGPVATPSKRAVASVGAPPHPVDPLNRSGRPEVDLAVAEADFVITKSEPVSTFSIDVDTGSYSEIRRSILAAHRLPSPDLVRIEELVNYFPYRYAPPPVASGTDSAEPFATHLAVASAPWQPEHRLVRIAIKGREIPSELRPPANLVFLVDTSGSMARSLALVRFSLRELLGRLRPDDRVAIVTFANEAKIELPSTPAERGDEIRAVIERLMPGNGTNGSAGIELAYEVARKSFQPEGVNRVILCTDGEFNVGVTGRDPLLSLIQESARSRVYLTVLGFGMQMRMQMQRMSRSMPVSARIKQPGDILEMLADNGNGAYGFVDSAREAQKILVDQVEGTLATIAKDVKIQVQFNPARVALYRLIGYENRILEKTDFNDDQADAGEIGTGHTITAFYEIVPTSKGRIRKGAASQSRGDGTADELLTLKVRYKTPEGSASRTLDFGLIDEGADFEDADTDFKFAAAVAAWGMVLRSGGRSDLVSFSDVQRWAEQGLDDDAAGYRAEFIELVRRSRLLKRLPVQREFP